MKKGEENFYFTFAVYFHFNVNLIMRPLKVDHVSHIAMKSMKSKPSYLVKLASLMLRFRCARALTGFAKCF